MKPYSLDLRERVIATLAEGDLTQPQIAAKYDLSLATVEKWAHRWRTTGTFAAKPHASGPPPRLAACATIIRAAVAAQPDVTLAELCLLIATQTHVDASASMMCRALQHLKLPRKKSVARQSARHAAGSKTTAHLSQDRAHAPRSHRRTAQIHR